MKGARCRWSPTRSFFGTKRTKVFASAVSSRAARAGETVWHCDRRGWRVADAARGRVPGPAGAEWRGQDDAHPGYCGAGDSRRGAHHGTWICGLFRGGARGLGMGATGAGNLSAALVQGEPFIVRALPRTQGRQAGGAGGLVPEVGGAGGSRGRAGEESLRRHEAAAQHGSGYYSQAARGADG